MQQIAKATLDPEEITLCTEQDFKTFDEIGIKYSRQNHDDCVELAKILRQYLIYPSDAEAQLHQLAYRLGEFDESQNRKTMKQEVLSSGLHQEICECCCCPRQGNLNYCQHGVRNIETTGVAVQLFFEDIRRLIALLVATFALYSVYGIVSNYICSRTSEQSCQQTNTCGVNSIALSSKIVNYTTLHDWLFFIQCWIGFGVMILWNRYFYSKSKDQQRLIREHDFRSIAASKFTVMIQNLPAHFDRETFQNELDQWAVKAKNAEQMILIQSQFQGVVPYDGQFKIEKFCIAKPYYNFLDNYMTPKLEKLEDQLKDFYEKLREWVQYRRSSYSFPVQAHVRNDIYAQIQATEQRLDDARNARLQELSNKYAQDFTKQNKLVFVTFHHTYAYLNMIVLNNQKPGLNCCGVRNYFPLEIGPGVKFLKAPEPQQVVWANVGVPQKEINFRKLCTYFGACVVLGLSFIFTYRLQMLRIENNLRVLSWTISIVTIVFDIALRAVIRKLSTYERDFKTSQYQVSLAIKTTIAQLINLIVLPVIADYRIKNNVYREDGLAEDVFYNALINALVSPALQVFDVTYFYKRFQKYYWSRPHKKIYYTSQTEYNEAWEGMNFEVGYEYIYVIKTLIFTAFFMSLQPIVVLFAVLGLSLTYGSQKFKLYYLSARPKSSSGLITSELNWFMHLSVLAYTLGIMTWIFFIPGGHPKWVIWPTLLSMFAGLSLLVSPPDSDTEVSRPNVSPQAYNDERLFFVTEYDRENPDTKAEGVIDYKQFVESKYKQFAAKHNSQPEEQINENFFAETYKKKDSPLQLMFKISHNIETKAKQTYNTITNVAKKNTLGQSLRQKNVSGTRIIKEGPSDVISKSSLRSRDYTKTLMSLGKSFNPLVQKATQDLTRKTEKIGMKVSKIT